MLVGEVDSRMILFFGDLHGKFGHIERAVAEYGVGLRGISEMHGVIIRPGKLDVARVNREFNT